MKHWAKRGLLVVLAAVWTTAVAHGGQWTFMVYLDADNNLEPAGIDDFLEMAAVGSDDEVTILVQMDRIPGFTTAYGDWTGCKRFRVERGMTPEASAALADLGEANMGDPATLTGFIDWGMTAFPADNYAVVIWNHGNGWQKRSKPREPLFKAVASDDTNGHDILYIREVREALSRTLSPVTLLGFDACLMGMVEVAYELRDTGPSFMTASEELEPGDGWPYDAILSRLSDTPSWGGAQLGRAIVDEYYAAYDLSTQTRTQAVIDMTKMTALAEAVSGFGQTLRTGWETDRPAVTAAAETVMNRIDAAVIHEKHGEAHRGAGGLAIYFPESRYDFSVGYNGETLRFAADTQWEEFLDAYYSAMSGSWIESARKLSVTFQKDYGGGHVDLFNFCSLLSNPPDTRPGYTVAGDDAAFEDIGLTGTPLAIGDEGYVRIEPDIAFPFYGVLRNGVSISDNGVIYFADVDYGNTAYINEPIPGSIKWGETFIAPYWDDLDPGAAGALLYEVRGLGEEKRLIVQWDDVPHYDSGPEGITFQAILYETGLIRFQYRDTDFGRPELDAGSSATVGLQGTYHRGLEVARNTGDIPSGTGLLFTPVDETGCTYALSADSKSVPSAGGKGAVSVETGADCAWSAATDAGWITIDGGESGRGSGTVSYDVLPNTAYSTRTGRIAIGEDARIVVHTVTQASACTYTVSPDEAHFPAAGGTGELGLSASDAACGWTAAADRSWITITDEQGAGNGQIRYTVTANPGTTARQGTIQAGGARVSIRQDGTVAPTPALLSNGESIRDLVQDKNGALFFRITVPSGAATLQIQTYGGDGNCDLFVRYGTIPESGPYDGRSEKPGNDETVVIDTPRAGDWFIKLFATQYFTDVSVTASFQTTSCRYALSPSSQAFTAEGGNGGVDVATSGGDCAWTADNPIPWVEIVSNSSGNGDGRIDFRVAPNLGTTSRQGVVTVVDQAFTITQSGYTGSGSARLENGTAVDVPAQNAGDARYYHIEVPPDQTRLTLSLRGDGDADLYVRYGTAPTLETYDEAPYLIGSDEDVTIDDPASGIWHLMVYAFEPFSGVRLTASYFRAEPLLLTSGIPVSGVAGDRESYTYFQITVPAGQESMRVATGGTDGDADLYLRYGELPTIHDYDAFSTFLGSNETLYVDAPRSGDWFILVHGYEAFSGLSVEAAYSGCGYTLTPSPGTFGAEGGTGTVAVDTTDPICGWAVEGSSPWIDVDPATVSGVGDGTVSFSVIPNGTPNVRDGVIVVAGQQVRLIQFSQEAGDALSLANRTPRTGLSGAPESRAYFRIDVPEGQKRLSVHTALGEGDCDLYLRRDELPTLALFDRASASKGTAETIVVEDPAAGSWYLFLHGYDAYAGVTLLGAFTPCDITLSPTGDLFTADGGTGRLTITPPDPTCRWTAIAAVPWITLDAGSPGVGEGQITYTVSPSPAADIRRGAIHVMGATADIDQLSADIQPPQTLLNGGFYPFPAVPADGRAYFSLTVRPAESILIESSGGTGDCDLYLRRNRLPTTAAYDERSREPGTTETLFIDSPEAGTWYLLAHFAEETTDAIIKGTPIKKLINAIPERDLSGDERNWRFFSIDIPAGQDTLSFEAAGGSGECDLYVRKGNLPALSLHDAAATGPGCEASLTIDPPSSGAWYALLSGGQTFSGVSFTATHTGTLPAVGLRGVIAILQTLSGIFGFDPLPPNPVIDSRIDLRDAAFGLRHVAAAPQAEPLHKTAGRLRETKEKTKPAVGLKRRLPIRLYPLTGSNSAL